tara:strand:+ start:523 stop:1068 length:546 start_codon:yes stop_codon:yes gene_type:complete
MSGEGKSVSFKRTRGTTKSNEELRKEFQFVVFGSPVTKHMKFYGDRWNKYKHTVELQEHGDEELLEWQQEEVAIKGTFEFHMSFYESWSEDWKLLEDTNDECSLVSLAKKFAKDNNLMFFPTGFPSSWTRRLEDGGFKQFIVLPDDKNIDKICELWLNDDWNKARDKIEQIMEKKELEHAI